MRDKVELWICGIRNEISLSTAEGEYMLQQQQCTARHLRRSFLALQLASKDGGYAKRLFLCRIYPARLELARVSSSFYCERRYIGIEVLIGFKVVASDKVLKVLFSAVYIKCF